MKYKVIAKLKLIVSIFTDRIKFKMTRTYWIHVLQKQN